MRRRSGGTCFSAAPRWTVRRLDRVFSPLARAAVRSIRTRFQLVTRRLLRDGESAWPTRQMRTSSDCLARSPGSHLAGICGDSRPRLSRGPVVSGRSVTRVSSRAEPPFRRSEGSRAHLSRVSTRCHSDRSRSVCDGGVEEPASPRRRTGATNFEMQSPSGFDHASATNSTLASPVGLARIEKDRAKPPVGTVPAKMQATRPI